MRLNVTQIVLSLSFAFVWVIDGFVKRRAGVRRLIRLREDAKAFPADPPDPHLDAAARCDRWSLLGGILWDAFVVCVMILIFWALMGR